uniref:Thioester reductase (TE) domain-containing protein n=1 Tax=Triticum urartu TaxID=4572 RepID=A0A8R7VEI1_TRIUA
MAIRVLFPSSQPQPHLQPSRSSTTTRRSSRQRRGFCCFCSSTSSGGGDEVSSSSSMMTVSITGATGFVGRRLVDKLLSAEDHKVCVLTRSTSKNKASSVFPASRYPGVTIADKEGDWERCIRDSTGVVNLA